MTKLNILTQSNLDSDHFPYRGSEGGGGHSHPAAEQSYPAGEFPEANRASERPDRYRELNSTGQGE